MSSMLTLNILHTLLWCFCFYCMPAGKGEFINWFKHCSATPKFSWTHLKPILLFTSMLLSFLLRISSVNVTKSAVSSGFGNIYWRTPVWKLHFLCSDRKSLGNYENNQINQAKESALYHNYSRNPGNVRVTVSHEVHKNKHRPPKSWKP